MTAVSMVLMTRSLPSFLALATMSSWLDSNRNPLASASCLALTNAALGAAAKLLPQTKNQLAANKKILLIPIIFIVSSLLIARAHDLAR